MSLGRFVWDNPQFEMTIQAGRLGLAIERHDIKGTRLERRQIRTIGQRPATSRNPQQR
jgi:hypothetical protein